jgi:hypothetical protein
LGNGDLLNDWSIWSDQKSDNGKLHKIENQSGTIVFMKLTRVRAMFQKSFLKNMSEGLAPIYRENQSHEDESSDWNVFAHKNLRRWEFA